MAFHREFGALFYPVLPSIASIFGMLWVLVSQYLSMIIITPLNETNSHDLRETAKKKKIKQKKQQQHQEEKYTHNTQEIVKVISANEQTRSIDPNDRYTRYTRNRIGREEEKKKITKTRACLRRGGTYRNLQEWAIIWFWIGKQRHDRHTAVLQIDWTLYRCYSGHLALCLVCKM